MASVSNDPNGRRRILFIAPDDKRKTIRLGKVSKRDAEAVKYRVESLLASKLTGHAPDADTSRWVAELEPTLAKKLAAVGLIADPEAKVATKLGAFLTEFVAKRTDVKPATREVWSQPIRNLTDHFGIDRPLDDISEGDAEDFKLYLINQKLAPTTVHKRLQFARTFFNAAKKRKLIAENPFAEVNAKATGVRDKQRFITREQTDQLLAACDPTWRVIVSLARYGGLRCPSEVLSLRWQDVNWETRRMVVQSPKTEHHGKERRTVPLFPEIRDILAEAFENAPEGAEYVVGGGHREKADTPQGWRNINLRTQFARIIKRAGLQAWPRPFQNLRACRETELMREHPIHVVTTWLGNTPGVAMKHYLQVVEDDFQRAIGSDAQSDALPAQNQTQRMHASSSSVSQGSPLIRDLVATSASSCETQLVTTKQLSGGQGIRTTPENAGKTTLSDQGDAESGAVGAFSVPDDPDLWAVIQAWPSLPEDAKSAVLEVAKGINRT